MIGHDGIDHAQGAGIHVVEVADAVDLFGRPEKAEYTASISTPMFFQAAR